MTMEARERTDALRHVRRELGRLAVLLERELARLRNRGRAPASEALRAFVIEGSEAERLVDELVEAWGI